MTIVGIETRTHNTDECDRSCENRGAVAALLCRQFSVRIAGRIGDSYLAPVRVLKAITTALALLLGAEGPCCYPYPHHFPPRVFLFTANDAMPQTIVAVWAKIWRYFENGRAATRISPRVYRPPASVIAAPVPRRSLLSVLAHA